jgi:hypothetical protein
MPTARITSTTSMCCAPRRVRARVSSNSRSPTTTFLGNAAVGPEIASPVCLDESLTSARATEHAIDLGACAVCNIKAARVGGSLEAVLRARPLC